MKWFLENEKFVNFLYFSVAVVFVFFAIVGVIRSYSPVPFWDMLGGYLEFYTQVVDGDFGAWWAQHNEHRIVLSRFFFWLDLTLFQGRGWFLLLVNYILMSFVCFLFFMTWREKTIDHKCWPFFFLVAWLFSWIQENNLTWGFQSQFILAQLIPLAAFYSLHRAVSAGTSRNLNFGIAVILGVLAIGSMANGVLVLPLMTVFSLVVRMAWRRSLLLVVLSVIFVGLYFYDFSNPSGHGSFEHAVQQNPLGLAHYVLLYVGGPFYYFFGKGDFGQVVAAFAGFFMIFSAAIFAWQAITVARKSTLTLALLTFILYVGGTAVGTAVGRLMFGVDQALSSRYMTPALMAWAALFLLYLPRLETAKLRSSLWVPFFFLLVVMLPQQLKALESKKDVLFERMVAALALELGVKDQVQIGNIFPSAEWALSIAEAPRRLDLSTFGIWPIKNAFEAVGKPPIRSISDNYPCQGSLDEVQHIEGELNYLRVRGWIFDPDRRLVPKSFFLVDEQGVVRGVALTGQSRPDVVDAIDPAAGFSGFKGYVQTSLQGKTVQLIDPESGCQLSVHVPDILFKSSNGIVVSSVSVTDIQIKVRNGIVLVFFTIIIHVFMVLWFSFFMRRSNDPQMAVIQYLVALGLIGYLSFWSYYANRLIGVTVSTVFLSAAIWEGLRTFKLKAWQNISISNRILLPTSCYALFILLIGFYPYFDIGNSFETAANRWLHLPIDNWIPKIFADQIWDGLVATPMIEDWHSSDRPPLQTGINLLFYVISRDGFLYQVVSSVLQSLVILPVFLLTKKIEPQVAKFIIIALGTTSLMSVHTLFVWPKLLSAAYVIVFYLFTMTTFGDKCRRFDWCLLTGSAAALAMLSHGGAVFPLVAIALISLTRKRGEIIRMAFPAVVISLGLYIPWIFYQQLLDPPGDRLLKWHLAGMIDINKLSFLESLREAYGGQSIHAWIDSRVDNIKVIFSGFFDFFFDISMAICLLLEPDKVNASTSIISRSFINTFYSFWWYSPAIALIVCFLFYRWRTSDVSGIAWLGLVSFFTLFIWSILMFIPASTVIHHGSFFSWLSLFICFSILFWKTTRWLYWVINVLNVINFMWFYVFDIFYIHEIISGITYIIIVISSFFLFVYSCISIDGILLEENRSQLS